MTTEPDLHEGKSESPRRRTQQRLLGAVAAVCLATVTTIVSGLGSSAVDSLTSSDPPLLSYSVEEQAFECGSTTFLPGRRAEKTRQSAPPTDWEAFQRQPGALFANFDVVQVSIQGESARKVTLTGIRFSATKQDRPNGATFSAPCGGPVVGRGVLVDVESNPPRIVTSSKSTRKALEPAGVSGSSAQPLTLPWAVSIEDPLLLYIVATAKSCYCTWTAEIRWVSGGEHGAIKVDNGGDGNSVVGGEGLPGFTAGNRSWTRFQ